MSEPTLTGSGSINIGYGALLPDEVALQETADALEIADRSGDDFTLANARLTRGATLVLQDGGEREHGFDLLAIVRQAALQQRYTISAVWFQDIQIAKEKSRSGDIDSAAHRMGAGQR